MCAPSHRVPHPRPRAEEPARYCDYSQEIRALAPALVELLVGADVTPHFVDPRRSCAHRPESGVDEEAAGDSESLPRSGKSDRDLTSTYAYYARRRAVLLKPFSRWVEANEVWVHALPNLKCGWVCAWEVSGSVTVVIIQKSCVLRRLIILSSLLTWDIRRPLRE